MSRQQENLGGDFAYEALPRSVPSQHGKERVIYQRLLDSGWQSSHETSLLPEDLDKL